MNENVLDLKSLQNKILELVEYFDLFCKENDIKYYLMGGTALGAIRHKGFIPWDDDFDVFMDSGNYKKFCNIIKYKLDKEKYFFQEHDTEENPLWFSKIRINNTTLIEKDTKGRKMHQGIFMDVMCLYNTPSNIVIRYAQYFCARILSAKALSEKGYLTNSKLKKIYINMSKYLITNSIKRNLYSFVNRFNGEESKMTGHLFGRTPFCNSSFKREVLGEPRYVQFEHLKLPVPQYAEDYLRVTFGESFMEIPSQEERDKHPQHAFVFDVSKSYKFYLNGVVNWRKYNGAMIPVLRPDTIIADAHEDIKSYISNNNAWFARWTSDFDSEIETDFWYVIQDKALEIQDYSSKTRNKIRKGLKNCKVRKINREEIIQSAYPTYYNAFSGYNTYETPLSRDQFVNQINMLDGERDYWGVYNLNEVMIGYSQNFITGDYCDYSSIKLHPNYLKLRPSEALIYTMNNYYLNEKKFSFVNNGTRSISHNTNIQSFLMKKFKFRKAYCKLHVIYSPIMRIMVYVFFPIKNLFKYMPVGVSKKVYDVLCQDKIVRTFK
jgi:lipopolysaccharide cholinephosphotransferase